MKLLRAAAGGAGDTHTSPLRSGPAAQGADACAYSSLRLLLEFAERAGHGARLDHRELLLKTLLAAQAAEDQVDASLLTFFAQHDVLLGGQHRDLWTTLVNGSHYHSPEQCAEVAERLFDGVGDMRLQHRLAHTLNRDGRTALAIAPERLRRRMRDRLLFCGRYELPRNAQPEHVSSSSLVFFASDLGQALEYEEACEGKLCAASLYTLQRPNPA